MKRQRNRKLGEVASGIDRRTVLAAAAALLAAPAIAPRRDEIVIVDGWVLSPHDIARTHDSPSTA
jgi:hypothetical protein